MLGRLSARELWCSGYFGVGIGGGTSFGVFLIAAVPKVSALVPLLCWLFVDLVLFLRATGGVEKVALVGLLWASGPEKMTGVGATSIGSSLPKSRFGRW